MRKFKVCSRRGSEYRSYCGIFANTNHSAVCIYRIGQETRPKLEGSGLFVFDTVEAARQFIGSPPLSGLAILAGEASGVQKPDFPTVLSSPWFSSADELRRFWANNKSLHWRGWPVPPGTSICDSFTPEKEV